MGDNERALSDIAQGLRLDPNDQGILDLRQKIFRQTRRAVASSAHGVVSSSTGDPALSQTSSAPESDTTKPDTAAIGNDWRRAKKCDQNGQYAQALYYYKLIFSLNPGTDVSRGSYRGMGQDYLKLRDFNNAVLMSSEAIKLGARGADIYRQRGEAYLGLGLNQQALEDFNMGIRINPSRADSYLERSKAYRAMGRADLAAADENRASALGSRQ